MKIILTDSARRFGDKIALVAGGRRLSFSELDQLSDRVAAGLRRGGVQRGDRVLIFMDNCWEAVVAIFAVLKAGAVFSPINPSTKADKLAFVADNCRAAAILTQTKLLAVARDALKACPSLVLTMVATGGKGEVPQGCASFEDACAAPSEALPRGGIDLDLAMLIYTSGSTGFPKGVMMTHQNIDAAATSITTYLGNTSDDVILTVLPISFDYGLYQVLMAAKLGDNPGAGEVLRLPAGDPEPDQGGACHRLPAGADHGGAAPADAGSSAGPVSDAALHHQHRGRAAAGAHRAPAGAVPDDDPVLDVRPHRVQALHLSAAGAAQGAPGSVGIAIPGTEAYVVDDEGRTLPSAAPASSSSAARM